MHHVLAIFSAGKFHNGPATISTESMAGLYLVPRNIYTNMVQNSADSKWALVDSVERKVTTSTHSRQEYCAFFQH